MDEVRMSVQLSSQGLINLSFQCYHHSQTTEEWNLLSTLNKAYYGINLRSVREIRERFPCVVQRVSGNRFEQHIGVRAHGECNWPNALLLVLIVSHQRTYRTSPDYSRTRASNARTARATSSSGWIHQSARHPGADHLQPGTRVAGADRELDRTGDQQSYVVHQPVGHGFTYVLSAMTGQASTGVPAPERGRQLGGQQQSEVHGRACHRHAERTRPAARSSPGNAAGTRFLVFDHQVQSGAGVNGNNILGGTLGLNLPAKYHGPPLT